MSFYVITFTMSLFSPDATLTVDNVTTLMELVTADGMMVVWWRLDVPVSLVAMIMGNLSTPKEKTRAFVDLYFNCHPNVSWYKIGEALYYYGEMAAAREAKPFYYQNGNHHCLYWDKSIYILCDMPLSCFHNVDAGFKCIFCDKSILPSWPTTRK